MPPRPIDQRPNSGRTKRNGREGIWEAVRVLARRGNCFTNMDVSAESGEHIGTCNTYLRSLVRAGYLAAREPKSAVNPRRTFELIRDSIEAPRVRRNGEEVTQSRPREQMWRTMKMIKEFSFVELAHHASTEEHPVPIEHAKDYIKHLYRAGYLALLRPGAPARPALYQLLPSKYTGPRPPQVQRVKQVYDPNLQRVVWPAKGNQ